ncbi:single-stranded DNA-binding protein [Streptomyces anulatus]|uniref:single-stranded DNA-binding protein n=1 Tax=Streptomyces anulatus TaxID=1892 RepID=UPI00225B66CC|nr:single-stranded DNA-binding protein [Streptomyces anulatus]MCX4606773.1 single-stranded DNA-binding protein [Streptomyces anulatus]
MAGECVITIIGNLVDEPELRWTPSSVAVCKFRVASTPRKLNRETNTWEDDKDGSLFLTCSVWRQAAENAASTLQKGMRVIVQGRLKQRSYEDREGVKRTVYELDVDEVGPSLKSATAKVTKVSSVSSSGSGGQGQGREEFQRARSQQGTPAEDSWAAGTPGTSGGAPAGGGWAGGSQGGGFSDEPPF